MAIRVFISYRRDDTDWSAGRLRDRLKTEFGRNNVFFDLDMGVVDFVAAIREKLSEADVVVALIGHKYGFDQLRDEADYVRTELLLALAQNKLIPVLVEDLRMEAVAAQLPDELRGLANINARKLRSGDFEDDVDEIIERIRERVEGTAEIRRARRRRRVAALAAASIAALAVVALVAAVVAGLSFGGDDDDSADTTTATTPTTPTSTPTGDPNVLEPGDVLRAGDGRVSPNGRYSVEMTQAGALVVSSDGTTWTAPYPPRTEAVATVQASDGNFVVYPSAQLQPPALWSARVTGHPGARLVVADDGIAIEEADGAIVEPLPPDEPDEPDETEPTVESTTSSTTATTHTTIEPPSTTSDPTTTVSTVVP